MGRLRAETAVALALLALGGCGHTTNEALCDRMPCSYRPETGYRFDPNKAGNRDTLIVLTFSGGGIRAAALSYGTLKALQELPGTIPGESLLSEVDVISSVSGGSVTAAWYALKGQSGLSPEAGDEANELHKFLYNEGGMWSLYWRGLNPLSLARYAFTSYQRSDVLADFFSNRLFSGATYAQVKDGYDKDANQPFVILNATDLGHETGFPFTQNRFDLICSDLNRYKLAYAVAASADFPIVFSPIGVANYSADCPAHADSTWLNRGPVVWVKNYEGYEATDLAGAAAQAPRSNGLAALRSARQAREYVGPDADDRVLHLIDGGVVDNLGVQSTLALEDDPECAPGVFQRLKQPEPPAYRRFREVVYIVVNARSRTPTGIDSSTAPPDVATTALRLVDTPLDNTILGTQNYLTAELQAIAEPPTDDGQGWFVPDKASVGRGCWTKYHRDPKKPADASDGPSFTPRIVTIDFEMIPQQQCRDKFWRYGTTWTLPRETIDNLIALPKVLLRRSPELKSFYKDRNKAVPDFDRIGFPADFSTVCRAADGS